MILGAVEKALALNNRILTHCQGHIARWRDKVMSSFEHTDLSDFIGLSLVAPAYTQKLEPTIDLKCLCAYLCI